MVMVMVTVIMIATDENAIVIMLGFEHDHAAIGRGTKRTARIVRNGKIDLVLNGVGSNGVGAAGASRIGGHNSLVLVDATGIDNAELLIRPMRSVSEEVVAIAWVKPDFIRPSFVDQDVRNFASVLVHDSSISDSAGN